MMYVLIVSSDADLLDDLLRLAAAADVEARVESDPARARSAWRDATLVVAGADSAAELPSCAPPRRPDVILVSAEAAGDVYRQAVDIGAQDVAVLPDDQTRLVERMAAAAEPNARAMTVGVIGGRGGAGRERPVRRSRQVRRRTRYPYAPGRRRPARRRHRPGPGSGRRPGRPMVRLLRPPRPPEQHALHDSLPAHDGLAVLSWHRGAVEPISAETMRSVLDAAVRGYDLVITDLPRHLSAATTEALSTADTTLLVVPAEVRATVAADRVADTTRRHTSDLRLVVRGPAPGGLKAGVIAESFRLPLAGTIPTDRRLATTSNAATLRPPPARWARSAPTSSTPSPGRDEHLLQAGDAHVRDRANRLTSTGANARVVPTLTKITSRSAARPTTPPTGAICARPAPARRSRARDPRHRPLHRAVIDGTSSTDLTDAVRARLTETGVALAAAHSVAAHLLDTLSRRR